jgi:hypothetical protein
MMTPPPARSLVLRLGGVEMVLRPGGVILFGGIALALDITFLPLALPGQPALTYHAAAVAMTVLMIVTTLLHESGHALACRAQGIWPVRITLRASGGACAAVVTRDTPARALVRALAGPAMTALVVGVLLLAWRVFPLPPIWRLIAATLAVFSLCDLVFNTLPVHPRCDGSFALRAALWLVRGREPEPFAVLYVWRPVILAAAALALPAMGTAIGVLPRGPMPFTVAAWCALLLCAIPPLALGWRLLKSRGLLAPRTPSA